MRPPTGAPRNTWRVQRLFGALLVLVALLAVAGLPSGSFRLVSPALAANPSPSDSPVPSVSPSPSPSDSPVPSPAPPPSVSPSPSDSPVPSVSPSPSPSDSPVPSPAPPPSVSPSPSPPITYGLSLPTRQAPSLPASQTSPSSPASSFTSPHAAYALATDACAACHRTHSSGGPTLTLKPAPQSRLCFTCHDAPGSGSIFKTQAEFTAVPPNDPANDTWYSHPATVADGHTSDVVNEFGGITNRHSGCADCHDSHDATFTPAVLGPNGTPWSAPGSIAGASSVTVTNTAGGSPTYAFVQGPSSIDATGTLVPGARASFEYQLCFKCHSGFTTLTSNASKPPSQYTLDKGIELDPLNAKSYHPVEAAGTNTTPAMTASLNGTSPYKLWTFGIGDTVRCTSCHAGPTTPAAGTTADATLPVHASQNRGILIAPYRDRTLKPAADAYVSADFALCLVCHAEAPYADPTATSVSNFNGTPAAPFSQTFQSLHALHLAGIGSVSTGSAGSIDTPGAGQGNATCAECHFRLHSTAQAFNTGDRGNTRLVNFAPDVLPYNGTLQWTSTAVGQGGCTLTCHGYAHQGTTYKP